MIFRLFSCQNYNLRIKLVYSIFRVRLRMKTFYKSALIFIVILVFSITAFTQTNMDEGIEFYISSDYKNAVKSLLKTLETDENNQIIWRYLGMSYARLNQNELADEAFEKADTLSSNKLIDNETKPKLINKAYVSYTDKARNNRVQGLIKVALEINKKGRVAFVFPYKRLPDGLTKNVVNVFEKLEFEPATKNDKPITVIQIIQYNFTIY